MARSTDVFTVTMKDGTVLSCVKPKTVFLIDFADAADGDSGLEQVRTARAYVDAAIIPTDRDALYERIYDPDSDLDLDDALEELIPLITEAATARPTPPSSASSKPPERTGSASTAKPRSTVARRRSTSPSKGS